MNSGQSAAVSQQDYCLAGCVQSSHQGEGLKVRIAWSRNFSVQKLKAVNCRHADASLLANAYPEDLPRVLKKMSNE